MAELWFRASAGGTGMVELFADALAIAGVAKLVLFAGAVMVVVAVEDGIGVGDAGAGAGNNPAGGLGTPF